jgi:hypothetical protein
MMLTRGEFAVGGALSIVFDLECHACCGEIPKMPNYKGCYVAHQELPVNPYRVSARTEDIIAKSGNADFDYALAQTLTMLVDAFGVVPGFAYYDDVDDRNANAQAVPLN